METKKHEGLPVAGYRPQSAMNVALVNLNKEAEERLLRQMECQQQAGVDGRWLAIAKTHLEQAFMAWNRAIFQPARASLPEDAQPDQAAGDQ
jgi:hypothetical protein